MNFFPGDELRWGHIFAQPFRTQAPEAKEAQGPRFYVPRINPKAICFLSVSSPKQMCAFLRTVLCSPKQAPSTEAYKSPKQTCLYVRDRSLRGPFGILSSGPL